MSLDLGVNLNKKGQGNSRLSFLSSHFQIPVVSLHCHSKGKGASRRIALSEECPLMKLIYFTSQHKAFALKYLLLFNILTA